MSWLSKLTGRDKVREGWQQAQKGAQAMVDTNNPTSPLGLDQRFGKALDAAGSNAGWEDAFNKTAGAEINNALPSLRQGLQLTREDAIRRGVSTGDLGTSNEGDLVSAWQRNLSNAFAGQALNAYNTGQDRYLDLLTGAMDRQTANSNAQKKSRSGLFGALGTGLGAIGGAFFGNPWLGAEIGGSIGAGVGGG